MEVYFYFKIYMKKDWYHFSFVANLKQTGLNKVCKRRIAFSFFQIFLIVRQMYSFG